MKFHWFHLMPYPELPENFKDDYRSVWVDVPSSLFDPESGTAPTMTISTSSNMPRASASTVFASTSIIRTLTG